MRIRVKYHLLLCALAIVCSSEIHSMKEIAVRITESKSTEEPISVQLSFLPSFTQEQQSFDDWYNLCQEKLTPGYKPTEQEQAKYPTTLTPELLKDVLTVYAQMVHADGSEWKNGELWLDGKTPNRVLGHTPDKLFAYNFDIKQPFVEKRILPTNSRVAIHGDLHGGIFELLEFIRKH